MPLSRQQEAVIAIATSSRTPAEIRHERIGRRSGSRDPEAPSSNNWFGAGDANDPGSDAPLLGVFLEDWLASVVRLSVRPKTFVSYRSIVRIHLVPALGAIPIDELRPRDVQAYLNAKAASGLAPRSVAYQRNILRQALGHAD